MLPEELKADTKQRTRNNNEPFEHRAKLSVEDVRPLWFHEGLFLSKSGPFYISPHGPERLSPMARVRLEIPALKGGEHT